MLDHETLAKPWSLKTFVHKSDFAYVNRLMTLYA